MPTIEQAIEHMQERIRAYTETVTITSSDAKKEKMQRRIAECELAIQALQEQRERMQGCEYCKDEKRMVAKAEYLDDNGFYLAGEALTYEAYVDDAGGSLSDNTFIHFCPMCGRKLTKPEVDAE